MVPKHFIIWGGREDVGVKLIRTTTPNFHMKKYKQDSVQHVTTFNKSKGYRGNVPWDSSKLHNLQITMPLNNL